MQEPDFAEYYRSLSDAELEEIAADWHSLLEDAKFSLSRRGLELDIPTSQDNDEPEVEYRDLVTIRQYRDLSEAIVARGSD